jgi:hypothetical protein
MDLSKIAQAFPIGKDFSERIIPNEISILIRYYCRIENITDRTIYFFDDFDTYGSSFWGLTININLYDEITITFNSLLCDYDRQIVLLLTKIMEPHKEYFLEFKYDKSHTMMHRTIPPISCKLSSIAQELTKLYYNSEKLSIMANNLSPDEQQMLPHAINTCLKSRCIVWSVGTLHKNYDILTNKFIGNAHSDTPVIVSFKDYGTSLDICHTKKDKIKWNGIFDAIDESSGIICIFNSSMTYEQIRLRFTDESYYRKGRIDIIIEKIKDRNIKILDHTSKQPNMTCVASACSSE